MNMRSTKELFFIFFASYALAAPSRHSYRGTDAVDSSYRSRAESATSLAPSDMNRRAMDKLELAIGLEEAAQQKAAEAELLHSQAKESVIEALSSQNSYANLPLDLGSSYEEFESRKHGERLSDPLLDRDLSPLSDRYFYEDTNNPELPTSGLKLSERRHKELSSLQYPPLNDHQALESLRLAYLRDLLQRSRAHRLPKPEEIRSSDFAYGGPRIVKRRPVPQFVDDLMWSTPYEWYEYPKSDIYSLRGGHNRLLPLESIHLT